MTIISMTLSDGGERHWRYSPACSLNARNCDGCAAKNKAVLRVVVHHGEADEPRRTVNDSLPLCRGCSMSADRAYNAEWPPMTDAERVSVWGRVDAELQRQAEHEAERQAAVTTSIDELQNRLLGALQQPKVHQTLYDAVQVG